MAQTQPKVKRYIKYNVDAISCYKKYLAIGYYERSVSCFGENIRCSLKRTTISKSRTINTTGMKECNAETGFKHGPTARSTNALTTSNMSYVH